MAFKKIAKRSSRSSEHLTIEPPYGQNPPRFRFTVASMMALGHPEAVHFEWDDEGHLLRIVASNPDDPDSYKVPKSRRLGVATLLEDLDIEPTETSTVPLSRDTPGAVIANLTEYRS